MTVDLGDLANCPSCGKPTIGPLFSGMATEIGVSEERLLKVLRKKQSQGFRGFACRDCTPKDVQSLWKAWADAFRGKTG